MKERSYSNTKEPDVDAAAPRISIWKKHETVIQERIVRHINIDDGVRRELIETETSQNEVVHLETKDFGEFSHREYTQQEQTEELDGEIVTFIASSLRRSRSFEKQR